MNGRNEGRWKSKPPPDGIVVSASPNKMEENPGRFLFATSDKMCAPGVREAQKTERERRERKTVREGGKRVINRSATKKR